MMLNSSRGLFLILALSAPGRSPGFPIEQLRAMPNGMEVQWTAEIGKAYVIESAETLGPSGNWLEVGTMTANRNPMQWTDPGTAIRQSCTYRVRHTQPAPLPAPSTEAILLLHSMPLAVAQQGRSAVETCIEAVFAASQLAGSTTPVTSGTLTESGAGWTYAATPTDRLIVSPQNTPSIEFEILEIGGATSGPADFLGQAYDLEFRVVIADSNNAQIASHRSAADGRLAATIMGTLTVDSRTVNVNLSIVGEDWSNGGFGWSHTLQDLVITGSTATTGFQIDVNERWRYELIANSGDSASTVEDWLNSTLTHGADLYVWQNVKRQKSFTDGQPSAFDTYWDATGTVSKNGVSHGTYYRDVAAPAYVRFMLDVPGEDIEIESWLLHQ